MKKERLIVSLALVILILCLFTGCAKKGYCEECGQYETLNKFVDRYGDEHWYCDDDYRWAKMFY